MESYSQLIATDYRSLLQNIFLFALISVMSQDLNSLWVIESATDVKIEYRGHGFNKLAGQQVDRKSYISICALRSPAVAVPQGLMERPLAYVYTK
jgi:hypothetical protein